MASCAPALQHAAASASSSLRFGRLRPLPTMKPTLRIGLPTP